MKQTIAYEDAVEVLDADHKAVKKMFIDFTALSEDGAPAAEKRALAQRICRALTLHAQIEEEIFYPAVRESVGEELMDEALEEHAEAKETIARIEKMKGSEADFDATVIELGKLVDHHVLEEREQVFLRARMSDLDLRSLALPLFSRKQELARKQGKPPMKEAA